MPIDLKKYSFINHFEIFMMISLKIRNLSNKASKIMSSCRVKSVSHYELNVKWCSNYEVPILPKAELNVVQ